MQQGKRSTGVGIVLNKKEAYSISIDKRCSIFTAEAIAIEKAIEIVHKRR